MYVLENWSNWLRVYASQGGLRQGSFCLGLNRVGEDPVGQADVCTMGCCGKKKLLMIMTSVCACASFAFLCIAVATDYWLFAIEKVTDYSNGTADYKLTITGLWRKCVVNGRCFLITCLTLIAFHLAPSHLPVQYLQCTL